MTTLLLPPQGSDPRTVATAVNAALKGKLNSVGTVTLTASAGSTTVNNAFVSKSSAVFLTPQTAHASAEQGNGTVYIDPANTVDGASFVITHANNSQADRTFNYFVVG